MTIEERFREAAASLVAQAQDNELLARQHGQLQAAFQQRQRQAVALQGRLQDGQAIVLALLDCEDKGMDYWQEQSARAREWLAGIGKDQTK